MSKIAYKILRARYHARYYEQNTMQDIMRKASLDCLTARSLFPAAGAANTFSLLAAVCLAAAVRPSLAVVVHLSCAAITAWAAFLFLCAAGRLTAAISAWITTPHLRS